MTEFTELDRKQWLIDALRKKLNRIKEQRQDDIDEAKQEESLAFADWLEPISEEIKSGVTEYSLIDIEKRIEAKIKELRSNPLQQQSVDGNERSERKMRTAIRDRKRYSISFEDYNPKKHIILMNRGSFYEVVDKENRKELRSEGK